MKALANGWSIEEVAENYRIPVEVVGEALRYTLERLKRIEVVTSKLLADENIPWPLIRFLRIMRLDVLWVPETIEV